MTVLLVSTGSASYQSVLCVVTGVGRSHLGRWKPVSLPVRVVGSLR